MTSVLRLALGCVTALLVLGLPSCGTSEASSTVVRVDPRKAVQLIEGGDLVVLDVRSPRAFAAGHVVGAANLDASAPDFEERVRALDPDLVYLVYARDKTTSAPAADTMVRLGVGHVVDAGGFGLLGLAGAALDVGS